MVKNTTSDRFELRGSVEIDWTQSTKTGLGWSKWELQLTQGLQ